MNNEDPNHSDRELLRQYAQKASGPAFDELARRHLDHVFSAALRRVNGDHALAKDVTQQVFIDFARKAGRIPEDMPPGGWLHRHTGFVSSKMIDKESRLRARENTAATMNRDARSEENDADWAATAPLLDAAMDALPASDRDAVVLRFFEQRDFRSVGAALGMSDGSAQKKVSRAVDKLRTILQRRGVAGAGGALAVLLTANSVGAAPASLAGQISTQSLAGAASTGGNLADAWHGLGFAARMKGVAAVAGIVAVAGLAASRIATPSSPVSSAEVPVVAAVDPVEAANPVGVDDAAEPMTVDALVAAAAAEWGGGRETVTATARALGFLGQVAPEQMPRALEIAAALDHEPARVLVTRYLLSHWAESQPGEALYWATGDAPQLHRADVVDGVLNAWAGRDPDAVMGWKGKTMKMRPVGVSESVVGTVFRTLAKSDPAKALSRLSRLESPNDRSQGLRGILDTVRTDAERERIAAEIEGIGRDDIRVQARRAMVEQWARRDPVAAAEFVQAAEPAWERTRLMDSLGFTWMQSDPGVAADWWVERAPGPDTLVKIINVWAQQDPNAAAEWLGARPAGAASDTARMTFSRQVADLDPESALRWAQTVSDASMRESTIDHVFANWRLRDGEAALRFLQKSDWSAERIARLNANRNAP